MKILVLVAHPDDEAIMCGGTINKLASKGHRVHVGFFTKNEQAYFGRETQKKRVLRTVKEVFKSSQSLGYQYNFLGFKDMELQENKGKLIQATIKEIRKIKPDVIITHHQQDKHIDHRTLAEIIPEANWQSGCYLAGGTQTWRAGLILLGEVDLEMTAIFNFQVIAPLALRDLRRKIKALACYQSVKSEHQTNQNWLLTKIETTAKLRGKTVGVKYGEAFSLNYYSPISTHSIGLLAQVLK